jgi:3-methyladenine DNA glycosylase AlkD
MKTFEFRESKNNWKVIDGDSVYISDVSPIELYKKEVNEYHNLMLEKVLNEYNYLSLGEVALWLQTDYNDEANKIINWWKLSSEQVIAHLETITDYGDSSEFCSTIIKY